MMTEMGGNEPLSKSTVIVATDCCLSTTIDGEAVILHTDAEKYYGFNEVGTYIWELVQEPHTIEEVCRAVTDEYGVTYECCREDIHNLTSELIEYDLVRTTDTRP